jgi:hypothetical protein
LFNQGVIVRSSKFTVLRDNIEQLSTNFVLKYGLRVIVFFNLTLITVE